MRLVLSWLVIVFCLSLANCASFTGDQIAEVNLPTVLQEPNKPNVYIDFHFYWGEPGSNQNERMTVKDDLVKQFDQILKQADLFDYYTFNQFSRKPNDYTIKVNVYNHGSFIAMIPAFITGLSLYIIPSYATDHYVLTWQVLSPNEQRVIVNKQNEDYIRTWQGIWFLPLAGKTPHKAVIDTFDRQVKNMLKQMIDQQIFNQPANSQNTVGS